MDLNFSFLDEIPSVNILVGGGCTSIEMLHHSLFCDDDTTECASIPVVILKNSGGAADALSDLLESYQNGEFVGREEEWKNRLV